MPTSAFSISQFALKFIQIELVRYPNRCRYPIGSDAVGAEGAAGLAAAAPRRRSITFQELVVEGIGKSLASP